MNKLIVTGIDMNRHHMTAVTLMRQKQSFSLIDFRIFQSSGNIFPENEVLDYQNIVKKLAELRKGLPFFSRHVAVAIPDLAIMSRIIRISPQNSQLMEALAVYQAFSGEVSLSVSELRLDYTGVSDGFRVYAARKDVVESRLTALRGARLKPILVDTEKQCFLQLLITAMQYYGKSEQVLIEVNRTTIRLGVMCQPDCFYRCMPQSAGENEYSAVLAQLMNEFLQFCAVQRFQPAGVWLIERNALSAGQIEATLQCPVVLFHPLSMLGKNTFSDDEETELCALAAGMSMRGIIAREEGYAACC
ncbi:Competence protein A [Vibrio aerogenes CECT 7868]|uniref:Competence protein A n=1 Tax=Vibrio aerogenes CECT 7868 TaxID=1216006 RepID=A0A1M5U6P4_9VIBR|nr:pilus assembly protein PilM [Vibrio aerogenes]SHH58570.1 Competence protein A [Vibrio aerogenes CECT 7868]